MAKGNKPTSYDVAKLAGVSQATVSLVLNRRGKDLGISAETAERVRAAAQQLSYYPNSLVRSIQRGRTEIVGIYGRDHRWSTRHSYWIEALGALHTAAADRDRELLIFSDHPNRPPERQLERMLSGILDGVVVQPGEENDVLASLANSRLPVVCIGDLYPGVPSVAIDNRLGIEILVDHLMAKGHRSLAMLNLETASFGSRREREETFLARMQREGLPAGPSRVAHTDNPVDLAVDQLLALDPRPTAILCFNDEWAYHTLDYCSRKGIRVPEDLAVTGFDGIPLPLVPRQVTTVRSPIAEMCQFALDRLLQLIEGEEVPLQQLLPVELQPGDTT